MSKKFNIMVLGATGKLGSEVVRAVLEDPRFNLVEATVTQSDAKSCQIDGRNFKNFKLDSTFRDNKEMDAFLFKAKREIGQIFVIDCTSIFQATVAEYFSSKHSHLMPVLILGTVGKGEPDNEEKLKELSSCGLIARCSNAATGLNNLLGAIRGLKDFCQGAQAMIIEEHHRKKLDKPSGYAKSIMAILESQGCTVEVDSVREQDECPATHLIAIQKDGQEIVLKTKVQGRKAYAKGAVGTFLPKLISLAGEGSHGLYDW